MREDYEFELYKKFVVWALLAACSLIYLECASRAVTNGVLGAMSRNAAVAKESK